VIRDLSLAEARRIALAAQGFDRPRPSGRVRPDDLRRTIHRLGLLQIDYFNVLSPAQYLVPFSRLGPYDRSILDELTYGRREFIEHWAHEASIVPVGIFPLLGYRRETHRAQPHGIESFLAKHSGYVDWVLEEVRRRGPLDVAGLKEPEGVPRRIPGTWMGTIPRAVLEAHFGRGRLAVAARLPNFSRTYDLVERVVPAEYCQREVGREESQRELLGRAARSHGVGTAADLADYYRMPIREARPRLAELAETGELAEVRVESWREPAYLHRSARCPRRIEAAALVAPFDPVIWFRPRAERLFGFEYRLEVFVPRAKLKWGGYVLPFLLGDRLVARVDLKADRVARRLLAPAAYLARTGPGRPSLDPSNFGLTGRARLRCAGCYLEEHGADPGAVAAALAGELRTLAGWLGLERVAVGRRGGFARTLAAALS